MRLAFALLFISTLLSGQRTLYMLADEKTGEAGAMFSPGSFPMVGIWGAYNGPFRAELSVDKFTDFFGDLTVFGLRMDVPFIKQSDNMPINIIGDGAFNRTQGDGTGFTTYSGSAIISHQVRGERSIISPYGSAGYFKFTGGGEFKWTLGVDALFGKALVGVEYERIGSSGTTYFRAGLRFGGKKKSVMAMDSTEGILPQTNESLRAQEEADAARLQRELAQADSLNQELAKSEKQRQIGKEEERQKKLEAEQLKQRQLEAEQLEQQRKDQEKADLIKQQQEEMERLRQEQEAILNRQKKEGIKKQTESDAPKSSGSTPPSAPIDQATPTPAATVNTGQLFSVQFFASSYANKQFDNLSWLSSILVEKVEGKNIYRYKTGYFGSRYEAERVAEQLKNSGYPGAFVKEED